MRLKPEAACWDVKSQTNRWRNSDASLPPPVETYGGYHRESWAVRCGIEFYKYLFKCVESSSQLLPLRVPVEVDVDVPTAGNDAQSFCFDVLENVLYQALGDALATQRIRHEGAVKVEDAISGTAIAHHGAFERRREAKLAGVGVVFALSVLERLGSGRHGVDLK